MGTYQSRSLSNHDSAGGTGCHTRSQGAKQRGTEATRLVLEALGNQISREILRALTNEPHTGRELSEALDVARSTVYRQLKRLEERGLVAVEMQIDADGHHRKEFHVSPTQLEFELEDTGLEVQLHDER